jgi:hypothetical protein
MATQPKPKPKPEPPAPGPDPEEEDAATSSPGIEEPPQTNASGNSLTDRLDALFTSHVALIERVEKLEERVAAPPIPVGRHVAGSS